MTARRKKTPIAIPVPLSQLNAKVFIRASADEIARFTPEQRDAFMSGLGRIITAQSTS